METLEVNMTLTGARSIATTTITPIRSLRSNRKGNACLNSPVGFLTLKSLRHLMLFPPIAIDGAVDSPVNDSLTLPLSSYDLFAWMLVVLCCHNRPPYTGNSIVGVPQKELFQRTIMIWTREEKWPTNYSFNPRTTRKRVSYSGEPHLRVPASRERQQ